MAGDWIKMRGSLMANPKLIAMANVIHRNKEFREWLTPGGSGEANGQIVSESALRCVTCALLLKVWSAAREYGKLEGDHLFLAHLSIPDLDPMADCPGVGKAMAAVGWAEVKAGDPGGVILPNFKQHNAPMTSAEKQSAYRNRRASGRETGGENVTKPLPRDGNKKVTEKRREEKRRNSCSNEQETPIPPSLNFPEFILAWKDWMQHRKEIRKKFGPTAQSNKLRALEKWGVARAVAAIRYSIGNGWEGIYEEKHGSSGGRSPSRDNTGRPNAPGRGSL
jgi:hypothetical protein